MGEKQILLINILRSNLMDELVRKICWGFYYCIAYYLPKSNARIALGSKHIRAFLVKRIIRKRGNNVNIQRKVVLSRKLIIGDNSGVGIGSVLQGEIIIGNNVMIGPECYIFTQNHAHSKTDIPMIDQGYEAEKPVIIGDDVWIGSRVTILPGVSIGKGVVIGASSVVTKNIPDYSIAAGNPARVLKSRLNDE